MGAEGAAVDQLLAQEGAAGTLWALGDHLNTVRDLAANNAAMGETSVVNHRTYSAFGELLSESFSNLDHASRIGFTGRPTDSFSGLQNNLHRWYDSATGRWITQDPISFSAGDANLYRYVGNNATGAIDPSGLEEASGGEFWFNNGPTDWVNPFAYAGALGHWAGDLVGNTVSSAYYIDTDFSSNRQMGQRAVLRSQTGGDARELRNHQRARHFAASSMEALASANYQIQAGTATLASRAVASGALRGSARTAGNAQKLAKNVRAIDNCSPSAYGTNASSEAFHYTSSQWAEAIKREGLRPGSYATQPVTLARYKRS